MRSLYFLLTFATVTIFADKVKYDNYKLYKLIPENLEDLKVIQNLEDCDLNVSYFYNTLQISVYCISTNFCFIARFLENQYWFEYIFGCVSSSRKRISVIKRTSEIWHQT